MGRPIIGITGELDAARWGNWIREAVVSPVSYTRAVERAGGTPVILPPVPADSVPVLIGGLHGLVLTGGRDVDPALYDQARDGQTDPPDYRRDRFELILTRAAIEADLPFLAISRGLHVLNVARGGTLTQHLPDRLGNEGHKPDPVKLTTHDVQISAPSKLGRALGESVQVPAAHHQAIETMGSGLLTVAWTIDQVVEAVELQGHRFGVGVQWLPQEGDDLRLFQALVAAASTKAAATPQPEVTARAKRTAKRHTARSSLRLFTALTVYGADPDHVRDRHPATRPEAPGSVFRVVNVPMRALLGLPFATLLSAGSCWSTTPAAPPAGTTASR
jgi:putative glutamine amidotransferase